MLNLSETHGNVFHWEGEEGGGQGRGEGEGEREIRRDEALKEER